MSPVAQATNILQAEANAQMGWLFPTVNLLTTKLDQAKLQLKYCRPLVDALLQAKVRSSSSDNDDDFFSTLQSSQAQDGSKQLDGYSACSADV
ncbi:hypothetical protein QQF64_034602 [Cirrhinus molitorella]|uniref:Uncharacterized protein n=1 Tax=Cirrhinus molitorella TaxID=172907 RepID=A0ABR3L0Z9_9TELE